MFSGFVFHFSLLRMLSYFLQLLSILLLYRFVIPHPDFKSLKYLLFALSAGIGLVSVLGLWSEWIKSALAEKTKWGNVCLALILLFLLLNYSNELKRYDDSYLKGSSPTRVPTP